MGVVTVGSVKASPGATTVACLLAAAWPGERIFIEADDSGGVLAPRLGLSEVPSTLQLASAVRGGLDPGTVRTHTQTWSDSLPVLVSPREPAQVVATFRELAEPLSGLLLDEAFVGCGVLDAGRVTPASAAWPLVRRSLVVLLVARCRLDEFGPLAARAAELRAAGLRVRAVLVAEGPYKPDEFATRAGIDLAAVVPFDACANDLSQGHARVSRRLVRSGPWREIAALGASLADELVHAHSGAHAAEGTG